MDRLLKMLENQKKFYIEINKKMILAKLFHFFSTAYKNQQESPANSQVTISEYILFEQPLWFIFRRLLGIDDAIRCRGNEQPLF